MSNARNILGAVSGAMLVASSAMHSFLGWPSLRGQLQAVNAPASLIGGLAIGWHFAGLAIWAFGIIALKLFVDRLRGRPAELWPAKFIAVVYTLFGIGAIVASMEPFFLIFVVPGALMAVAAWQPES